MRFHAIFGAHLVALALASGGPQPAVNRCYTQYGKSSRQGNLPTVTKTSYTACTVTTTSTKTVTSTAKTIVTSSATVTSTVSTVSTVAAPGFSAIQDTLPGAGYDGALGPDTPSGSTTAAAAKRDESESLVERDISRRSNGVFGGGYPNAVTCWHYTNSKCSTTAHPATATAVVATKKLPTTTVTTTVTTTSYTSTAYAACQTNNFADYANVNGDACYIQYAYTDADNIYGNGGYDESFVFDNPYDCCVYAATDPHNAMLWAYEADYRTTASGVVENYCLLFVTATTCPAQDSAQSYVTCTYDPEAKVVAGNGPCGEINSNSVSG